MQGSQEKIKQEKHEKSKLLWDFMCGSKLFFCIGAFSALLMGLLDMLVPQIIRTVIDSVLGEEALRLPSFLLRWVDALGGREVVRSFLRVHLGYVALAVLAVALLAAFNRYLTAVYNTKAAETLVKTMRDRLFAHIQRLPFSWHMQNQTGDMIQRCTSDVDVIKQFVSEQLTGVFRIAVLLLLSLIFMFAMNVKLALVALVTFSVIIAFSALFHGRIGHVFTECDENEGVLSTIAQENLTGVRVVRAFGREAYEKDRFEKQNTHYTNAWMKLCRILTWFWAAGDIMSGLQVMLMVVLGSVLCVHGALTAGELVAFITYNAMLVWPVRSLGRMIAELSKTGVSLDRINYIMRSPVEEDVPDACAPDMTGDICFQHVNFGYDAHTPVLQDVSFTVRGGTTFGILGGTGSGKSTLMHLLNRLYELQPGQGEITIGGVPVRQIKAGWLRSHIGMVLQEPFLFSRTIAENIGITWNDVTPEQMYAAARIACVDDTVREFGQGYDTMVGERGVTLSGGQKQRVAIARMLMQKTPIMVFDDSLSAVDAETDAKIRGALNTALGNATVILIAHRITTLMHADCIAVMDKGHIVQLGTHEQLLAQDGIYKSIYELQMKCAEEVAE